MSRQIDQAGIRCNKNKCGNEIGVETDLAALSIGETQMSLEAKDERKYIITYIA
jgi:hypothetical protein